jgi:hypothetical protein
MISLFAIAPNDQSIYYLTQLFGFMGNVLPSTSATLLGAMFKTLNTTALVLGSIMVVNTTVVGLLKTAQEGEFLGKQWSSMWVPFRMLLGIASLFPTSTGYSMLQVAMMWFIVQGVGAADTLWSTIISYVANTGSPYSTMAAPTIGVQTQLGGLMQSLVCQAEAARTDADNYQDADQNTKYYFYCGDPANAASTFCKTAPNDVLNISDMTHQASQTGQYITYNMGPNASCGTLQYADPKLFVDPSETKAANKAGTAPIPDCSNTSDNPAAVRCAGIKAQVVALQGIVNTMSLLATTIAELDHEYLQFFLANLPIAPAKVPEFIQSFCSANNIPKISCCVYTNLTSDSTTGDASTQSASAQVASASAAYAASSSGGHAPTSVSIAPVATVASSCDDPTLDDTFPHIYMTQGNQVNIDKTNASKEAATQLYWAYGLLPGLGAVPDIAVSNTTYYVTTIMNAVSAAEILHPLDTNSWQAKALSTGWLLAGSYYYQLASQTNSSFGLPQMSVATVDPFMTTTGASDMHPYRNNFEATGKILATISAASRPTIADRAPPTISAASSVMSSAMNVVVNNFENMLSGGANGVSNPLVVAQSFGESLLSIATNTYEAFLGIAVGLLIVANLNAFILGFGFTSNFFHAMVMFLVVATLSTILAFCGWCITIGGMLAIYTPLVPYIIFTMGAIGWFIATIEAMVAAPFVALGILSNSGHHEILGRAEPAVMILLNTFLRPALMVLGMMAAMLIVPVVVSIVNNGYNAIAGSIYPTSNVGSVELLLYVSSYTMLVVTSMNKCFQLIYIIPERVLTWIGGHAISYGEGESLQTVKRAVEGAAEEAKSQADHAGGQMLEGLDKMAKGALEKNQQRDESKKIDSSMTALQNRKDTIQQKQADGTSTPAEDKEVQTIDKQLDNLQERRTELNQSLGKYAVPGRARTNQAATPAAPPRGDRSDIYRVDDDKDDDN